MSGRGPSGSERRAARGLDELVSLARGVATDAAELVADRRRGLAAGAALPAALAIATKSSATDLVTEADRAAERLIIGRLLDARPYDGVVGEEGGDVTGTSGVRWLVDPIDGTTNFVYDHPGFAVSIAAELDGAVAVGVVADPRHGELFWATAGRGAYRNGAAISVTACADLAQALVATGFSYDRDRRRRQAQVLVGVLPAVRDIRRMGAASVDLCSMACGRVDATYERGLQAWDYAAGALIASEAGAIVGDLDGGPPSSAFCLAAPPSLHREFVALLAACGARDA